MLPRSVTSLRRVGARITRTLVLVIAVALVSSGTAVAASYLALGGTNTATKTTTLRTAANAAVLQVTGTGTGSATRGIGISVPAGRAPITVNSGAGKATNLNADKLDGIDATGFVRGPVEAWHEVGTAGNPAFFCVDPAAAGTCMWANFDAFFGYNSVAFYKDPLGVVHLKGLATGITTFPTPQCEKYAIFTLPVGYRPARTTVAMTLIGDPNTWARLDILTDGKVTVCLPETDYVGKWISLDGIEFRAN